MVEKDLCTIRILVVDDQFLARSGLISFLLSFDDLDLAGQAASGEEAIVLCATLQPDVVVMDLVMPGIGGLAAVHAIRTQWPDVPVVAISPCSDASLVQATLRAGAACCLTRHLSANELAEAIRTAYRTRRAGRVPPLVDDVSPTVGLS